MWVLLNGRFVEEAQAVVSVHDRGFLYGDGLFETMRVEAGIPFRWTDHWNRLEEGMRFLGLKLPYEAAELHAWAHDLIRRNQHSRCLLRVTVSRGPGPRGYSVRGANQPTLVMSLHPRSFQSSRAPVTWRLRQASLRLPAADPLARFKTANKLVQVLARREAEEAGGDEALLLNERGHVVETTAGNLFWWEKDVLLTPPLSDGALPGITRRAVLELAARRGYPCREQSAPPANLFRGEGVFLTLTSLGIVEVVALDGRSLPRSERTQQLHQAYQAMVLEECTQKDDGGTPVETTSAFPDKTTGAP